MGFVKLVDLRCHLPAGRGFEREESRRSGIGLRQNIALHGYGRSGGRTRGLLGSSLEAKLAGVSPKGTERHIPAERYPASVLGD